MKLLLGYEVQLRNWDPACAFRRSVNLLPKLQVQTRAACHNIWLSVQRLKVLKRSNNTGLGNAPANYFFPFHQRYHYVNPSSLNSSGHLERSTLRKNVGQWASLRKENRRLWGATIRGCPHYRRDFSRRTLVRVLDSKVWRTRKLWAEAYLSLSILINEMSGSLGYPARRPVDGICCLCDSRRHLGGCWYGVQPISRRTTKVTYQSLVLTRTCLQDRGRGWVETHLPSVHSFFPNELPSQIKRQPRETGECFVGPLPIDLPGTFEFLEWHKPFCIVHGGRRAVTARQGPSSLWMRADVSSNAIT